MNPLFFVAAALAVLLAAGCASHRDELPPIPSGVDPAHLHFHDPTVGVGDRPEFALPLLGTEQTLSLSDLRGRPTVLVFGSFT
jgi:hypothetical protein